MWYKLPNWADASWYPLFCNHMDVTICIQITLNADYASSTKYIKLHSSHLHPVSGQTHHGKCHFLTAALYTDNQHSCLTRQYCRLPCTASHASCSLRLLLTWETAQSCGFMLAPYQPECAQHAAWHSLQQNLEQWHQIWVHWPHIHIYGGHAGKSAMCLHLTVT